MSIETEISRIQSAKADIKTAIEAKGVTVPSSATIDTYDDYVSQISGGGGGIPMPSNLSAAKLDNYGLLKSAAIKNGVTSIGNSAFKGCSSLSSIEIPNSVKSISNSAFYRCTSLTSITVNAETPPTLGTNVFNYTNDCPIYVPSGSVNAYKSATNWSKYASRIQAIS